MVVGGAWDDSVPPDVPHDGNGEAAPLAATWWRLALHRWWSLALGPVLHSQLTTNGQNKLNKSLVRFMQNISDQSSLYMYYI